jgi:hypothetical protein
MSENTETTPQVETPSIPSGESSPDIQSMLDEISSDVFGGSSEENTDEGRRVPESPPSVEPAAEDKAGENSEEVQALGAPSTWTKEALAEWATMSPTLQKEVLKREEDFHKGIESYKARAEFGDSFAEIMKPYETQLAAENVDPRQLVQAFAANHYTLLHGTPAQKTELTARLILGYGINVGDLADNLQRLNYKDPAPVDPEVANLKKEVQELRGRFSQQDTASRAELVNKIAADVDAFAKDPAHPFFEEVSVDIEALLRSGVAKDLQDAYDRAVWANPTTRAKVLDAQNSAAKIAQEEAERQRKASRGNSANIAVLPNARSGTTPVGTIDDTLEETLAAIKSRGG